jgi:hypothetical protein
MLREVTNAVQHKKPPRRWFTSTYFDLIVWYGVGNQIVGFELCYGKPNKERALCWMDGKGYAHFKVHDGEHEPLKHKMTPVYVADEIFDKDKVCQVFIMESKNIDKDVSDYVIEKIIRCNPQIIRQQC